MSIIQVNNLTFGYEGSIENVFENVTFNLDTDWKLGLIGRNGKGKTTLLKLLQGKEHGKVLIARSITESAHIYIWDEPLNYIDILTRIQIEEVILKYKPTIIFVEHDETFVKNIATKIIRLAY